jgi:hypothetical protein
MTDMILTLAQDTVRDDILQWRLLSKGGAPPHQLREILLGILALVDDELDRYPPELHPKQFFSGRTVMGSRGTRPVVRLYLHKLHKYLSLMDSKNLSR